MNLWHARPRQRLHPVSFSLSWWRFQAILNGLDSFLTKRSSDDLWALGPLNRGDHNLLIELLSANLLVFGVAWHRNFKRARERNESDGRAAMWGGGAALVFALLIFQVAPYRVLYQSQAERVAYGGDRCYLVGQRLSEALLFCPRRPPPWQA